MLRSRSVLAAVVALASLAGCTGILGSFEVGPAGTGDGGGTDGGSNDGTTNPDAPDPFSITVTKSGSGQGKVTSTPNAIDCGAICGAAFPPGTSVTLTATPQAPSTFDGWGGACSGTATCTLTVDKAHAVTAKFSLPGHNVKVVKTGTGRGTVKSTSPSGIDCGGTCDVKFDVGTKVTLQAVADAGSIFAGWKQACTGDRGCEVTVDGPKVVEAEFMELATWDVNWSLPGVSYSTSKLDISTSVGSTTNVRSTVGRATGKWYWEIKATAGVAASNGGGLGIMDNVLPNNVSYIGTPGAGTASGMSFGYGGNAQYFFNWAGASAPSGQPPALSYVNAGIVYMFALDATAGMLWCGQDGQWYNTGDPGAGAAPAMTGLTGTIHAGVTFYGNSGNKFAANFGQSPFNYTVPTGFAKGLY